MPAPPQTGRAKPRKTAHTFTAKQQTALDLLVAGRNDREVAEQIGARRETVRCWRHDPDFAAELESRRSRLWAPYVERLHSLIPRALEVIEWQALAESDLKLAFKLLELAGLDLGARSTAPPPPLHPPVLESDRLKNHLALRDEFQGVTGIDPTSLGRPQSRLAKEWITYLDNKERAAAGEQALRTLQLEGMSPDAEEKPSG